MKIMLTQKDIDRLLHAFSAIFITKVDLQDQLQDQKEELDKKYNQVITRLDAVMKELKDKREEEVIMSHMLTRHTKKLESNETRLQKLERHSKTTSV